MTERIPYEEHEPRSEAQADLGGGMHTYYREGKLEKLDPETGKPREAKPGLTSQQKNYRARRLEEEHLRRKETPMLEPSHDALRARSKDERAEIAGRIRKLRGILYPNLVTSTATQDVTPDEARPQSPSEER